MSTFDGLPGDDPRDDPRDDRGSPPSSTGELVSAVVVVRPSDSASDTGGAAITAANVGSILPDPDSAERLRRRFARLGFDVGPVVAIAFSITADAATFDEVFPSTAPIADALAEVGHGGGSSGAELALSIDDLRRTTSTILREAAAVEARTVDPWADVDRVFVASGVDFGPGAP